MDETPEVVVVGAACRDLVDDDARGWRLGGGAPYSALMLARLGLRVGALMVADEEAEASTELRLVRQAGVDLRFVDGARGPVFVNVETPAGRRQLSPRASDPVDPSALPAAWRPARAWMLVPVAAEVDDAWAAIPRDDALVAVGWQGLLRSLRAGEPVTHRAPVASPIVRRANLIGVGRDDVHGDTSPEALLSLLRPGATLLVTDGARGGTAHEAGDRRRGRSTRRWDTIPPDANLDPVGAGDTFLAGVFAARIRPALVAGWAGPDPDLRLGAACASLVLESAGMFGVPHLDDVLGRMRRARPDDGRRSPR